MFTGFCANERWHPAQWSIDQGGVAFYGGIPITEYFSEDTARLYWSAVVTWFDEYQWKVEQIEFTNFFRVYFINTIHRFHVQNVIVYNIEEKFCFSTKAQLSDMLHRLCTAEDAPKLYDLITELVETHEV